MKKKKNTLMAYLCSAPSLLLILLIVVFPILYTAYISFSNMNVYHWYDFTFVGLENYRMLCLFLTRAFWKLCCERYCGLL